MYTVDDQGPYDFVVSSPSFNNQKLFERQLSPGQHNLVVTYLGSSNTVAMGLRYLIQQDGTSSTSSSTPSPTSTFTSIPSSSSSNSSPSSSTPTGNHAGTPTGAIIGGVIGGLVLISLLLALFFFNRRRNNRRSEALGEMSYTPDVVNPFTSPSSNPDSTMTFLPPNYNSNSNGQSVPSQFISSKFTHQRGQPSDPASIGSSSGGGIPPLTPLRPQFSSPASTPSDSSPLPLTGSQTTNLDNSARTRVQVPQAEMEPSMQRSPSPQGANVTGRILRHDDSGVRIPAENEVLELPPFYTPE
jgi:hypothetical protein